MAEEHRHQEHHEHRPAAHPQATSHIGAKGLLHRENQPDAVGLIVDIQGGRDAGDHLIEFADGGDGRAGNLVRQWFVIRPRGVVENGTFEL